MAVSSDIVIPPSAPDQPARSSSPLVAYAALTVAAIVVLCLGAAGVVAKEGTLRIALVLVPLVVGYMSLNRLVRVIWGPRARLDLVLSGAWLALIAAAACLANVLPLSEARDASKTLRTPILQRPDLFSAHPLGTDRQGLDILGGVIYGARISLIVGVGAVLIGLAFGGVIGMIAGYRRGIGEWSVQLITDSMLAFPPLIFLLGLVTVLSPSTFNVALALGALSAPSYARLTRANTLTFAQREFIVSARAIGERDRSIVVRELLPNVIRPVFAFSFVYVAVLIVAEASLSFLGLGIQRPTPTWGNMISAGQNDFDKNPHLVLIPGVVLFLTVFSLNRLGDVVQARWEKQGRSG